MKKSKIQEGVSLIGQGLHHLFWPAICVSCREIIGEGRNGLCKNCWDEVMASCAGDYCPRCGRDVSKYAVLNGVCPWCQGEEIYFDNIARAGVYDKSLRSMILAFKKNRVELDSMLGSLVNSALQGSGFYNEIEMFVPVPLHWTRRLIRGYNQSRLIAQTLKHPRAEISDDLARIRMTKAQPAMQTPAKRAKNVAVLLLCDTGMILMAKRFVLSMILRRQVQRSMSVQGRLKKLVRQKSLLLF